MIRILLFAVTAAVAGLAGAGPAQASWSAPRPFPARGPSTVAGAVNGAGDGVVAWTTSSPVTVRVALLPRGGRRTTRVLWTSASRRPHMAGLTVALDARGGAVAAWIADGRLRTSHGTLAGRWSSPRVLARSAWGPVLAIARDRTELLAWTTLTEPGATGVSWRAPGQDFSAPAVLRRPRPQLTPSAPQSRTGAAFDAGGSAYLWGTCDGAIRVARPHSRHFGAPVDIAGGRALGFSLSVAGPGRGLASWVDSSCTGDIGEGPRPGPVRARALRSGAFGAPVALTGETSGATTAVALAGDGGLVAFGGALSPFVVTFDAAGVPGTASQWGGAMTPFADGGGDLMIFDPRTGYLVRPRGGGAAEPFDRSHPVDWRGQATASIGRAFLVVWDPDAVVSPTTNRRVGPTTRLSVAVWRP